LVGGDAGKVHVTLCVWLQWRGAANSTTSFAAPYPFHVLQLLSARAM